MARNLKDKKEHLETLADGEIPEVEARYETESEVKADARRKTPRRREEPEAKPPRVFRVQEDKMVLVSGYRTKLHAGKEVDEVNYDVRRLKQQGVKLVEIDQKDRASALGSSFDDFR